MYTGILLGNWESVDSREINDFCLCPGSIMYQIFPILVILYTYLLKLYMYRQWAD